MILAPSRRCLWRWLAVILLLLGEFLVFDAMTSRYHASVFPRWTDQSQYLNDAYRGYEAMRTQGFWSGLKAIVTSPIPQGKLHDFAAATLFWFSGHASRSAALSLNMLAFMAWQAALMFAVVRKTDSPMLAWMGFGLLLCLAWPWSVDAGSAVDFRLDHAAMCLVGISACAALLTDGYRSRRWSLVFGALVGLTIVERFLTGTYFALIFMASFAWISCGAERGTRLRNLCWAGLAAAVVAGPLIWFSRQSIVEYYWAGHMTSADANARAPGLSFAASVAFIVSHFARQQLGLWFAFAAVVLTAPLLVALAGTSRRPGVQPHRDWLFFSLAYALLPAALLSEHRQKSEFVLGVLVPGVMLFLLWAWNSLRRRIDFSQPGLGVRGLPVVLPLLAVGLGGGYFLQRQLTPPHTEEFMASARQVNQVADYLFATAHKNAINPVRISVDQWLDAVHGRTLEVLSYERHHQWLDFSNLLPTTVVAPSEATVLERFGASDFVLLTDQMPGDGYYPYDHEMRRLYPTLKSWCDSHLQKVETFPLYGRTLSLYQRREIH